jgi:hypothetical protein
VRLAWGRFEYLQHPILSFPGPTRWGRGLGFTHPLSRREAARAGGCPNQPRQHTPQHGTARRRASRRRLERAVPGRAQPVAGARASVVPPLRRALARPRRFGASATLGAVLSIRIEWRRHGIAKKPVVPASTACPSPTSPAAGAAGV